MIKISIYIIMLSLYFAAPVLASQTTKTNTASGKNLGDLKVKVVEIARQLINQMTLRLEDIQQKLEKPMSFAEEAQLKEKQTQLVTLADKVEKIISDKRYKFADQPVPCIPQDKKMISNLQALEGKLTGKTDIAQASKQTAQRAISLSQTMCK